MQAGLSSKRHACFDLLSRQVMEPAKHRLKLSATAAALVRPTGLFGRAGLDFDF